MHTKPKLIAWIKNKRGVVAVVVALSLVAFMGFVALAFDIGYLMVNRNQLQNAADAAALAGAGHLWYNATSSTPAWSSAQAAASTTAPSNKAGGITLVDYEVQTGYWNLGHTPPGLQSTTITPKANDAPAVEVTVRKVAGKNGGPVKTLFGSIIGKSTIDVSAKAIAVSNTSSTVKPGRLFPLAISREVADKKDQYNRPTELIRIGSAYHYPSSMAGQWTSLTLDTNNVPDIRGLIANGNPDPISIGTNIWIQPGTKTTLYSDVPVGTDVVLAVVDYVLSDVTHSAVPVYGFIGFHITASVGGSGKYIEGYFLDSIKIEGSPGSGTNYGVYVPPRLVQ